MAQQHDVDKQLEGRLFDLLETMGRVRLGTLVQLRRRSRSSGSTLLHVALDAGEVPEAVATRIAQQAGLEHPRAIPSRRGTFDLPRLGGAEPDLVAEDSIDSVPEAFDLGSVDVESVDDLMTPSAMPLPAPRVVGRPTPKAPPLPPPLPSSSAPPLPILKAPGRGPGPVPGRLRDAPTVPLGRPHGRGIVDQPTRRLDADRRTETRPGFPSIRPLPPGPPSAPPTPAPVPVAPAMPISSAPVPAVPAFTPAPAPAAPPPMPVTLRPSPVLERPTPPNPFSQTSPYPPVQLASDAIETLETPRPTPSLFDTVTTTSLNAGNDTLLSLTDSEDSGWPDTAPPGGDDDSSVELEALDRSTAGDRYALGREIGRGGMGQVLEAHDTLLDRAVALKLMNEPDDAALRVRFVDEAKVTGQLQHPGVPPVYEVGRLGDGRPFFAMKRLEGRTLRDVIEDLRDGDSGITRAYGRVRLMTLFASICRTIAYAHDRGVMHRDLKPDNIMLGAFGEVTVMDWGLAKPFEDTDAPKPVATQRTGMGRFDTLDGEMTGTPNYMPPEQARGDKSALGPHTDIYSLGAVLYELLTLEPPFDGPSPRRIREAVLEARLTPPSRRAPGRDIPHELEELCLHCLRRNPAERPRDAAWVADRIEGILEGEQDRARVAAERDKHLERGQEAADSYGKASEFHRQLQARVAILESRIDPWAPRSARVKVWAAERAEKEARSHAARALSEALAAYHAAVAVDGEHRPARQALADLYWLAFASAERDDDTITMAHYEGLVRAYDVGDQYSHRLAGEGSLMLDGLPPGLDATLARYELSDRVLAPVDPVPLTARPIRVKPLAMGSYLIDIRGPGLRGTRVPVHIARQEALRLRIRVFPDAIVGAGFVHLVAGPARLGGDPQAALGQPARVVEVGDVFMARQPVTAGAYLVFLHDLVRSRGLEAALRRAPRRAPRGAPLWPVGPDGLPTLPEVDDQGQRWHPQWPVVSISADDAEAYCIWLTEQTGQVHRLPSEEEWEKAARGADGRFFPWGNAWEPTFCHMGVSRPGTPERGPSGAFPTDISPYGVVDLAGGISEWTASWIDQTASHRVVKGGHWASSPVDCRAASRQAQHPDQVLATIGFRLARDAR